MIHRADYRFDGWCAFTQCSYSFVGVVESVEDTLESIDFDIGVAVGIKAVDTEIGVVGIVVVVEVYFDNWVDCSEHAGSVDSFTVLSFRLGCRLAAEPNFGVAADLCLGLADC